MEVISQYRLKIRSEAVRQACLQNKWSIQRLLTQSPTNMEQTTCFSYSHIYYEINACILENMQIFCRNCNSVGNCNILERCETEKQCRYKDAGISVSQTVPMEAQGMLGVLARTTECSEVHSSPVMLEALATAAEEMPIYRTCLNRAWVCSREPHGWGDWQMSEPRTNPLRACKCELIPGGSCATTKNESVL